MSIRMKAMVAGAAAVTLMALAGAAQAQPGYGYEGPPPPPYQEVGGGGPAACGRDNFTLLGAHAGVTVLGLDLGGSAHLSAPIGGDCGQGYGAPAYEPRPYAPPEQPAGYGPPSPCGQTACGEPAYAPVYMQPQYAEPQYAPPAYAPQSQPMWSYGSPCGCAARGW